MTLRIKIAIALLAALAGFMLPLAAVARHILMDGFLHIEMEQAQANIHRTQNALRQEVATVLGSCTDYSNWDEAFHFVQQPTPSFVALNLSEITFHNLKIHGIAYFDQSGRLVQSSTKEAGTNSRLAHLESFFSGLPATDSLLQFKGLADCHSGLIRLSDGIYLVAARPISNSAGTAPAAGTLVFAKHLDASSMGDISSRLLAEIEILPLEVVTLQAGERKVASQLARGSRFVTAANGPNSRSSYAPLANLYGQPLGYLRVTTSRPVYRQGLTSQRYTVAALFLATLFMGAVIWVTTEFLILRRLSVMSQEVNLVGVTQDLTKRVTTTEADELSALGHAINQTLGELQAVEQDRQQLSQQLHSIMGSLQEVVWSISPDMRQTYYLSPSAEHLFGIPQSQLEQSPLAILAVIHPVDRARVFNRRPKFLTESTWAEELRLLRADGSIRWIYIRSNIIRAADGRIERINGTTSDITEIKQVSLALEKAHQDLFQVARRAGMAEMATGVLHNIGNILNSVNIGVIQLQLMAQTTAVKDLQRVLALLNNQATSLPEFIAHDPRGAKIPQLFSTIAPLLTAEQVRFTTELDSLENKVSHVRDIIRAQQAHASGVGLIELVDLGELVTTATSLTAETIAASEVRLTSQLAPLGSAYVAKASLLQVLVNLLRNACEATQGKSPAERRVDVALRTADSQDAIITVSDNGQGIEPQNLVTIFSLGFTTKRTGHGFGLHSCANLMTELGGSITVTSAGLNQGATFTLRFPYRVPQSTLANPVLPLALLTNTAHRLSFEMAPEMTPLPAPTPLETCLKAI